MDFIIQKATELGVIRIIPVITARSVPRLSADRIDRKLQHWQKIMVGACEQSGRTRLVNLHPPMTLSDVIKPLSDTSVIYLTPRNKVRLSAVARPDKVSFIIGPEGGFTDEETAIFRDNNFTGVNLGPRILRTETAAIAALATAGILWGDLK